MIHSACKTVLNALALLAALPPALTCWAELWVWPRSEVVYQFWTHIYAILPGLPGLFLRRAFYFLTLRSCALDCYIGYGVIFTHRLARVEVGAYIGPYALIGWARLGAHCLIGSRASLLSGGMTHRMQGDGKWSPFDPADLQPIDIGTHVWIGEGAIVMAPVGAGAMVAAGSVVSNEVPEGVMVGGNPARFVRHLAPTPTPAPSGRGLG